MSEILVHPKKGEPFKFALPDKEITIGRLPTNDLALPDQFSSGCHAAIFPSSDGYSIRDMGSKNGTSVNGQRIAGETELKKGDKILVGSTIIYFEDYQTEVEITSKTDLTHSSNTIIQVKDILHKPPTSAYPMQSDLGSGVTGFEQNEKISRILADVNGALICHMPLNDLLDHVMDLITKNVPMDRAVLMLKEGKPEKLQHQVVRVLNQPLRAQKILVSQSIVQTALDQNSSILIGDVRSDTNLRENPSIIRTNLHSAMCVPLWNDKEIIGLIYADRISIPEQFTKEDLKLLTILANTAALKIENARIVEEQIEMEKLKQQIRTAEGIQRNFLPKNDPVFAPFDISGSMRACYHVGGDYYDFISLGPDLLAVVIADVSGTGVDASLHMGSLRGSLYARISGSGNIAELTAGLNDFVHTSSESHIFISFFLGILDRKLGKLTYVNAGHNPPLLLDDEGQLRTLDSTGFCLGMFPSVGFEERTVPIPPGSLLCLFTDGITEGRNEESEEYGESRLAELIKESAHLPARDIKEKIYESVSAFTDCSESGDDMTLVVIKRSPEGPDG